MGLFMSMSSVIGSDVRPVREAIGAFVQAPADTLKHSVNAHIALVAFADRRLLVQSVG